ncbi:MAG: dihydrofolate reductase, partial [Bacteroidales bacterium]|nr:dihydrofolate reductase [Bacteroidales bacterium]
MKYIVKLFLLAGCLAGLSSCGTADKKGEAGQSDFKYLIDEFADLKIMRYRIDGFEKLTLRQQKYVYHLCEAAIWGRDIFWDQHCRYNLQIRRCLENIIENYNGDRECEEFGQFMVYAKRVFFSNGIHHHYAEDKIFPECSQCYFGTLLDECCPEADKDLLLKVIYDPEYLYQRKSTSATGDIVVLSAVNYYDGVTREEVENYYASIADP